MSDTLNPFVPTTTPDIERANRLMSLRAHPGFLDLLRICQDITKEAEDICDNFAGWDPQQMITFQTQKRAARAFHQRLLAKVAEAIEIGIAEGQASAGVLPDKSLPDIFEQGDHVRQKVLERFQQQDETRTAGSY